MPRIPHLQSTGFRRDLKPLAAALLLALGLLPGLAPAQDAARPPGAVASQAEGARPRIEKAADLPRFSYPVKGSLEEIVRSPERFGDLAAAIERDTKAVLDGYDIADRATKRELVGLLAVLDYQAGRYDASLARLDELQALQDKPAEKLLSGMRLRAMATAAKSNPPGSAAWRQQVADLMARALAPLPFAVVENDIRSSKASAELVGEGLVLGSLRERLQPIADASGALSNEFAPSLINARMALYNTLPLKPELIKVYGDYLAQHKVVKADIWAARDVSLPADGPYTPVNVAIWDSGVDTALFGKQVLRNADGTPVVLAFDKYSRPAKGELQPIPAELRARGPEMVARTKGLSDLQSGIDSPEASQVKQWLSGLAPTEYKTAIEELGLSGNYEHGTHVAGIALAGNPFARLVVVRIEFGHTLKPDPCPSIELAERSAAAWQTTIEFLRRNQVRVANLSWGGSVGDIERDLEECGIGQSPEERKPLARQMFDIDKNALVKAMSNAPEILFVVAAGNSNRDSSFDESLPADIALPNVLTVGAVDLAGDEAPFTSYGPTVKVHANGYQVESVLPGGARVALSGTSMAAPQVTNLAAKLLAVNPRLTVADLLLAITGTADTTADGRRVLVYPKLAVDMVRPRQR